MMELGFLTKFPEVRSAVLGDLAGGFHDAHREQDGESIAAVMGFLSATLGEAGIELGLGALRRTTVAGPGRGWVVLVRDEAVLTACVEPPRALAAMEKALETSFVGKE